MALELKAKMARAFSYVWRFQTLRVARAVFRRTKTSTVLRRRFAGYQLFRDVSRSNGHVYLEGERFVMEKSLVEAIVAPGMTVVDVGAATGYYMLLLRRLVGSKGRVICFEPEPENLKELKRNRERNHLANVEVRETAVGAHDGKVSFAPGLNGRVVGKGALSVAATRLDTALKDKVDVLKIDVEGYEGAVLEGAKKTIEAYHPTLFLEIHPWLSTEHSYEDIFGFLKSRYAEVEYYEVSTPSIWSKVAYNYFGKDPVAQIEDTEQLLADCASGRRGQTF